jgi:hypothetical protein
LGIKFKLILQAVGAMHKVLAKIQNIKLKYREKNKLFQVACIFGSTNNFYLQGKKSLMR